MNDDLLSIAFIHKNEQVDGRTFLQLCKNVEQTFHIANVNKGDRVIVAANKSIYTMAVVYVCIFQGIIFVPVDIKTARERFNYIVKNCTPCAMYIDDEFAERGLYEDYPEIKLISFENFLVNCAEFQIPIRDDNYLPKIQFETMDESEDVYIIYTSGSTGRPKGVTITRGGLANFIKVSIQNGGFSSATRFLNFIPLYFDPVMMEIFVPWVTGGTVVIFDRFYLINDLVNALQRYDITDFSCTPNIISMLVGNHSNFAKYDWKFLHSIYFGGEVANISDLMTFMTLVPNVKLINEYGPTETTVTCCLYEVRKSDLEKGILPIGYPLDGVEFLIHNDDDVCSENGVGELYVAGAQLMSGYWGEKKNLLGCHFTILEGKKYYMTGDMVYEKNGCYYFVGRKDNMIKHRGYRIYPNEIENAVNTFKDEVMSHVFYSKESSSILCAVEICCEDVDSKEISMELTKYLKNILPAYMIPSKFFFHKNFPRFSNGKIDLIELVKLCNSSDT